MAEQEYVRLHTRFYAGEDDDLIEWLNSLSHGEKSDAVKEALRRGLGLVNAAAAAASAQSESVAVAGLDRQALAEIRKVVETAIESALQQHGASVAAMPSDESPAADDGSDDEAEEILGLLDAGVTLD